MEKQYIKWCVFLALITSYKEESKKQEIYVFKPHSAGFKAAFPEGMKHASPALLEPIMDVEVITPDDYVGDVIGVGFGNSNVVTDEL